MNRVGYHSNIDDGSGWTAEEARLCAAVLSRNQALPLHEKKMGVERVIRPTGRGDG